MGDAIRILSSNAAGELIMWFPGQESVVLRSETPVELTHLDILNAGSKYFVLSGFFNGEVHLNSLETLLPALGKIMDYGFKGTSKFPVLSTCSLKIIFNNLFIILCKSYGSFSYWRVKI